jgi:polyketide cyclase/dehydrase/lipid transport protein
MVWDFTQDFSKRTLWDNSMIECRLISDFPERKAFIKAKGGMTATLEYKLFDRPFKTSLRMTNINSPLVADGGGSWTYEKQNDGKTLWTQTNSISLKNSFIGKVLKRFVEKGLKRNTIESMEKAKHILET